MSKIFRDEAVEALDAPEEDGALLRLLPGWTRSAYWLVLASVIAGLAYSASASVNEYAQGPAVVRVEGRVDLTTATGGIVISVDVHQGDRVKPGQVLVRFHVQQEAQELERIKREYDLQLVKVLLHPGDESSRQSLASLRATRELAEARLKERSVLAPQAGMVSNLRIRPGQMLGPGDIVCTLIDDNTSFSVVALVPGQFRPMLKRGLNLRLELEGYPYVFKDVPIESIGDEVVGPNEARRFLGNEIGDTLAVQGSLVLVRARLPDRSFRFEGKTYNYYDGIPGRVDIRVRALKLLVMIFPMFKEALGDGR
jgi:membrane fusion protein (multidrug efflux system)